MNINEELVVGISILKMWRPRLPWYHCLSFFFFFGWCNHMISEGSLKFHDYMNMFLILSDPGCWWPSNWFQPREHKFFVCAWCTWKAIAVSRFFSSCRPGIYWESCNLVGYNVSEGYMCLNTLALKNYQFYLWLVNSCKSFCVFLI